MNAVISGRAAVALLIEGEHLRSIHHDGPSDPIARTVEQWNLLLGDVDDLEFLADCDEATARDRLEDAVDFTEALDLVLYLFDGNLSDDIRRTASLELDELLAYPEIVTYLESILYARPLDESADVDGAGRCCDAEAPSTLRFIQALLDDQEAIRVVRHAFDSVQQDISDKGEARQTESVCIQAGVFARFAQAGDNSTAISGVWMAALQDKVLLERLPANLLRQTLTAWTKSLQTVWAAEHPEHQKKQTRSKPKEFEREERPARREEKRHKSFDRQQTKDNVDTQKEHAIDLLKRGKHAQARRVIAELVEYNLEHGGPEFACMTLCSLAKEAQDLELYEIQLELTERSIALDPDDGWSWAQHGKALLDTERPDDALHAYDRALKLCSDAEPRNGRTDVLKALGRLPEALSAYEEVIQEHPENVVAKGGRAEVLKAMGRLPEALAAYEEVIRQYPRDVVVRNGRAEVLKAMGKLSEALSAYEEVIREHPENVVARNGRAEVLKAMGQLLEALAAYEEVIREHPENVVAKTGRAELLKAMGQLPEALAAYGEVIRERPGYVVVKTGRAEVLKAMGKLPEALAAYEEVIREHPHDIVAKNSRAEVLKAIGRLPEALTAYEEVIREFPQDVLATTGRAEVLKGMGKLPEALVAYDDVIREHSENVVAKSGRACVLVELGRWEEALPDLPTLSEHYQHDWVGLHIRGMILLKTGQLDEARQVFEVGLAECPLADSIDYFRTGLGFVELAERRYAAAAATLAQVREPALQRPATLLRIHALGADQQFANAAQIYQAALEPVSELEREIKTELTFRYVERSGEQHDDPWLLEREVRCLLTA